MPDNLIIDQIYVPQNYEEIKQILSTKKVDIITLDYYLSGFFEDFSEKLTFTGVKFIEVNKDLLKENQIKIIFFSLYFHDVAQYFSYPGLVYSGIQKEYNVFIESLKHVFRIVSIEALAELHKQRDSNDLLKNTAEDYSLLEIYNTRIFKIKNSDIQFQLEPQKATYYLLLLLNPQGIRYSEIDRYADFMKKICTQLKTKSGKTIHPRKASLTIESILNDPDLAIQCVAKINAVIRNAFQGYGVDEKFYQISVCKKDKTQSALQKIPISSKKELLDWHGFYF